MCFTFVLCLVFLSVCHLRCSINCRNQFEQCNFTSLQHCCGRVLLSLCFPVDRFIGNGLGNELGLSTTAGLLLIATRLDPRVESLQAQVFSLWELETCLELLEPPYSLFFAELSASDLPAGQEKECDNARQPRDKSN